MKRNGHKIRLDQLLLKKNPEISRNRIQAEIMAGKVLVNGRVCDKPGTPVDEDADIKIAEPDNPYVSRGGLKLERALHDLSIEVNDLVVLDVGASTGGFTDCLLQKGARLIYALDVGYGQLDFKLRQNPRIVVMERFNIRHLKPRDLPVIPDLAVIDVSFISLSKVLPVISRMEIPFFLALVKPQFEVGRIDAGKGRGVIQDPELHRAVLNRTLGEAAESGYRCGGVIFSNYPGPKGNIEYFIYCCREKKQPLFNHEDYHKITAPVVEQAHRLLGKKKKQGVREGYPGNSEEFKL